MSGAKLWGRTLEVWQDTITAGPPTEDQDVVFSCWAGLQHTLIRAEVEGGFAADSFFFPASDTARGWMSGPPTLHTSRNVTVRKMICIGGKKITYALLLKSTSGLVVRTGVNIYIWTHLRILLQWLFTVKTSQLFLHILFVLSSNNPPNYSYPADSLMNCLW